MMTIFNKVAETFDTTKWAIIVALIAAGVSCTIIAGIIFLYVFAAFAHLQSGVGFVRALLWKT
jgi:hypothetical protein